MIKKPLSSFGYGFISGMDIPAGKDEYFLRNQQIADIARFRPLLSDEIELLTKNGNSSDDWNLVLVADPFNSSLIRYSHFKGLVRIGILENYSLEFSDLEQPAGIYHSTIVSCDLGDNVSIHGVHYLSHYIIGNEVMLTDINEMITTNHSKFGNGTTKNGESEDVRVWLEICNENGGRQVLPFDGMLPGDAWLWSRFREDKKWLAQLQRMTDRTNSKQRGFYGKIGNRSIIKHTAIIKDVNVGEDAYIKGASKLKNLTIHSGSEGKTQIGEGCEIVNGIIGYGCRIFYGVKAVRFVLGNHSQLKYGARLINSYLGSNSTISCCEVLNALIFPAHEQHHNNSFLCAAVVMGQSNIPAGATLGSNHNSRSADGELLAKRGFWPALCSNVKHNSRFASFTMLARGNYPNELDIPIPFSLVSTNEEKNQLEIMVGYWFLYNMYALERNAHKYGDRDRRIQRIQTLEYEYLAPDSVNELIHACGRIEDAVEKAAQSEANMALKNLKGKAILSEYPDWVRQQRIQLVEVEHGKRNVVLTKVVEGWSIFQKMLRYYGLRQLFLFVRKNGFAPLDQLTIPKQVDEWSNIGGQLIQTSHVLELKQHIIDGNVEHWDGVHVFYQKEGAAYEMEKTLHAFSVLKEQFGLDVSRIGMDVFEKMMQEFVGMEDQILSDIICSREKDYTSHFRKMMYESSAEMDAVIGTLDDNTFIEERKQRLESIKLNVCQLLQSMKVK